MITHDLPAPPGTLELRWFNLNGHRFSASIEPDELQDLSLMGEYMPLPLDQKFYINREDGVLYGPWERHERRMRPGAIQTLEAGHVGIITNVDPAGAKWFEAHSHGVLYVSGNQVIAEHRPILARNLPKRASPYEPLYWAPADQKLIDISLSSVGAVRVVYDWYRFRSRFEAHQINTGYRSSDLAVLSAVEAYQRCEAHRRGEWTYNFIRVWHFEHGAVTGFTQVGEVESDLTENQLSDKLNELAGQILRGDA